MNSKRLNSHVNFNLRIYNAEKHWWFQSQLNWGFVNKHTVYLLDTYIKSGQLFLSSGFLISTCSLQTSAISLLRPEASWVKSRWRVSATADEEGKCRGAFINSLIKTNLRSLINILSGNFTVVWSYWHLNIWYVYTQCKRKIVKVSISCKFLFVHSRSRTAFI